MTLQRHVKFHKKSRHLRHMTFSKKTQLIPHCQICDKTFRKQIKLILHSENDHSVMRKSQKMESDSQNVERIEKRFTEERVEDCHYCRKMVFRCEQKRNIHDILHIQHKCSNCRICFPSNLLQRKEPCLPNALYYYKYNIIN